MAQFIYLIPVIAIVLAIVFSVLIFQERAKHTLPVPAPPEEVAETAPEPETSIFSGPYNQNFDMALDHFSQFSHKARITFIYRFVEELSEEEALTMRRYISRRYSKTKQSNPTT